LNPEVEAFVFVEKCINALNLAKILQLEGMVLTMFGMHGHAYARTAKKHNASDHTTLVSGIKRQDNPLPASATLLDPTLAKLLLVPEMEGLLRAAKRYIIGECRDVFHSQAAWLSLASRPFRSSKR